MSDERFFGAKRVAESMTPEERATMIALADGFGSMTMQTHRAATDAFIARYPDVAVSRDGYRRTEGDRYVGPYIQKARFFSTMPTMFGLQVARMIERFAMPVDWPEAEDDAA